jgi:RNA polymerase-binding transcription factor DksA
MRKVTYTQRSVVSDQPLIHWFEVRLMLSPERIQRLQGYLVEQQTSLRRQLIGLTAAAHENSVSMGNHMADDATAAFDQAASVSLRRTHQLALAEVENALQRIVEGAYGHCDRCRSEIDFARLKVVPQASLCLACQKLLEL